MCERDLGELGETTFRGWCNAVGITIHKVEQDRTGWDFFIEFPWKKNVDLPRDMFLAPIECKVQVKATDQKNKSEKITVSNLNRLIKFHGPVFFCLIEFDGKDQPRSAYLVHVGEKIIGKTLKKIRELDVKGQGDKLNKHTICIRGTKKYLLSELTGQELKKAIESYLPDGLEKYVEHKNKLLNTLGFEDGKRQITITFSGETAVKDILDLSLGLRKDIRGEKSVAHYKRFGILSDDTSLNLENFSFSLKPKPAPAILKFKEYEFSPGISLNVNLYLSPFNDFLPHTYFKLRIESTFFNIVAEPCNEDENYPCEFQVELQSDKQVTLLDLKNHFKVFTLFKKNAHLILEIQDRDKEVPPIKIPSIVLQANNDEEIGYWSELYHSAEMASSICQRSFIKDDEVLISIDELIQSASSINALYRFLNADVTDISANFSTDLVDSAETKCLALTFSMAVVIGNYQLIFFLALIGSPLLVNQTQYKLIPDQVKAKNELVIISDEVVKQNIVDERFEIFEQMLRDRNLAVVRINS